MSTAFLKQCIKTSHTSAGRNCSLFAATSQNIILTWELDKHMLCFINSHMHQRNFHLFMQMIFISLSVFLKIKDYFPACEEKCLKQDDSWYSSVMVIVRKADLCNKKTTNHRAHSEFGDSWFYLLQVLRTV